MNIMLLHTGPCQYRISGIFRMGLTFAEIPPHEIASKKLTALYAYIMSPLNDENRTL